ncbi:MAG: hypothetical protein E6J91_32105 [Deltaproteobacteria bacterium]|nr:MAG: hypothetical protein E6J91_32105 [Deltaproteobacteria bacterium]
MTPARPRAAMRILCALPLALAALALAVRPARADLGAVSPGKLAAAHAAFEAQCERCHVPFGGVPQRQCLACHTDLARRIARGVGFHPTVAVQPCTGCHKEHRGRDAATPAPPSAFDHRTTGFALDGDHARIACERCHPPAGASRRWVGIATSCRSCHADRHRGTLGSDCTRCHRPSGWLPTLYGGADHRTPLSGGHARLACADCHRAGLHLAPQQPCVMCHAQPHGGTTRTCETCHRVAGWKQVAYTHAFPPSALPGKHQTAACLACHPAFRFAGTPFACAACHDKDRPHEPLGACSDCHSPLSWAGARFDHDRPAVGFALTGRHRPVGCAGCHAGGFRGAGGRCEDCHRDPHRRQFAVAGRAEHFDRPLAQMLALLAIAESGRGCAECHTTDGWRPSTITAARHAGWFALRGAHAAASCRGCHARSIVATARACSGCHPDVRHRGRFGSDCETCHDETAWSRVTAFDHARTGFALDNGHAGLACARCHGSDGLRLAGAAAPTACQTCHAAPHGTQFGERCTACHTTASFHAIPPFDHAARSDFPLELRHAALPCLSCHDARRRPVINRACRTCHGDPHRGSNAFDCSDCHRADRWRIVRFDHDLTAYPLTGRHRIAACSGCHANPTWTGVRTDCVACHAFDRPRSQSHPGDITCEDCHTPTTWRVAGPRAAPRRGSRP